MTKFVKFGSIRTQNDYAYEQWVNSIASGKTPDGKKLARVMFLDDNETCISNFKNVEIVGSATFLGFQFEEHGDGFVRLEPRSILIDKDLALEDPMNNREGIQITIRPPL